MKIGFFTDPHLNKKFQRYVQEHVDAARKTIDAIIDYFSNRDVDAIVSGGDTFDTASLEGWCVNYMVEILQKLQAFAELKGIMIYFNLGNHEIYDEENSILEVLKPYPNLVAVLEPTLVRPGLFIIPYGFDPADYKDQMKGNVIVTHHDIYGMSLAAGRSRAKFGYDPKIFKDAKVVLNGHVHSKSKIGTNIHNCGSVLTMAQGELVNGDHPCFYEYEDVTNQLTKIENLNSIHYVTANKKNLKKTLELYAPVKVILRYEYEDLKEIDDLETAIQKYSSSNLLAYSTRSVLDSTSVHQDDQTYVKCAVDIPNILVAQVTGDHTVPPHLKAEYIKIGKELLEKGRR